MNLLSIAAIGIDLKRHIVLLDESIHLAKHPLLAALRSLPSIGSTDDTDALVMSEVTVTDLACI